MNIKIQNCSASQFKIVKTHIKEFDLDNRRLKQSEFLVALYNGKLIGFGRIREHNDFSEACSLGIITSVREQGIGKILFSALIKKSTQPLYLACIIPNYFLPFGFKICKKYPIGMQEKLDYCIGSLPVPEKYVVMKLGKL